MKRVLLPGIALLGSLFFALTACENTQASNQQQTTEKMEKTRSKAEYAIVIHGGAGTIRRESMTPEQEAEYLATLNAALDIGEAILQEGGAGMDAVVQTIMHLEDSPLFNAGKGAVFTNEGKNELDASIMEGANRNAGAVGGVTTVKNPITAARAVLERSEHVLLTGEGAERFAREQGLEMVAPEYFHTERRRRSLERALEKENGQTGQADSESPGDYKFGTVGCVALDKNGDIVAGTSTGGMTNKRYNRFGDVPVIGAGTYASNRSCGVSCTGHGEFFIRYAVAHDMVALMEYKGLSLAEAGDAIIHGVLKEAGGSGGLIALDQYGNVAMPFNSAGMYRGYAKPGERVVKIFEE